MLGSFKVDNIKDIDGGTYYHFGTKEGIVSTLNKCSAGDNNSIHLQINIDGLPLFKSSSMQLWPILGRVTNIENSWPFVIGVYCGYTKPRQAAEYLQEFVADLSLVSDRGFTHDERSYSVVIDNFICDTPARAFIKNTKGHTGYGGCDKCTTRGVHIKSVTFPELDAPLRTDVQFDEMVDEDHHNGPNPLKDLALGMVSKFPIDYMHLVCLGVMRKLFLMWAGIKIKSPLQCHLGNNLKSEISEYLIAIRKYIPREFPRKPRSLRDLERWKATEFRLFLLYTEPIVLKNIPKELYDNFLLLAVAIRILCSPKYCIEWNSHAHDFFTSFVKHFSELYGKDKITYNVHGLIHLAKDVSKYGQLDNFSAFRFESFLYQLKQLVRKPTHILSQIVLRISEIANCPTKQQNTNDTDKLKYPHTQGPLPSADIYKNATQYKEVRIKGYFIAIKAPNNCVRINNKVALVQNIIKFGQTIHIVFVRYTVKRELFDYPMQSSLLDIHIVAGIRNNIETANISQVTGKYMLLPLENPLKPTTHDRPAVDVAIPLLHNDIVT